MSAVHHEASVMDIRERWESRRGRVVVRGPVRRADFTRTVIASRTRHGDCRRSAAFVRVGCWMWRALCRRAWEDPEIVARQVEVAVGRTRRHVAVGPQAQRTELEEALDAVAQEHAGDELDGN